MSFEDQELTQEQADAIEAASLNPPVKVKDRQLLSREESRKRAQELVQEAEKFAQQKRDEGWTKEDFAQALKELFEL